MHIPVCVHTNTCTRPGMCPCPYTRARPLEGISTQNGPPKKNKIIFINFEGRKEKKTTFFVCIFDISPCVFTQILIERARWMQN